MLASTLLVVVLISTSSTLSLEDEYQSGICGCPVELRESFHEDRIPAKIVERVCHQVGITCGASLDRATFSSVSNNYHAKKLIFSLFKYLNFGQNSVINWLDYWTLGIPGQFRSFKSSFIGGTSRWALVAFADPMTCQDFSKPNKYFVLRIKKSMRQFCQCQK